MDGNSTISGVSGASSSSSKRFRLFGFGKRRFKKKSEALEAFRAPERMEIMGEEQRRNMDFGYGYNDDDDNEQAPQNRQHYGGGDNNKRFEPLVEADDSSSEGSPRLNGGRSRDDEDGGDDSSDGSGSISAIQRQDSIHSASSSSGSVSSSSDSSQSLSRMDELKAANLAPLMNNTRTMTPMTKQSALLTATPTASNIEPQRNLKIIIPRIKKKKPPTPYSILTRTMFFQNLTNHAFDMVDTDHTGVVDEKQLYNALLLIHLKLGMVAGQAACRPLSRERSRAIFQTFDIEEHGYLNRQEFGKVMVLMFSNVLFRVAVQWTMTILIVPLVAKEVLDVVSWSSATAVGTLHTLREESWLFGLLYRAVAWLCGKCLWMLPAQIFFVMDTWKELRQLVPDRIWSAVPLTLLSTLLGILIVPLLIYKIDSTTQWVADRRHTKKMRKRIEAGET